jgi:competence protein ComEC
MATVLLIGPLVGRRYDPTAALSITAAIMILFNPNMLGDAGFLLSFGSMLGIALISPLILQLLTRIHIHRLISAPLAASFGATLVALPLSALLLGLVSLVGPFATLTSDLAMPPLMLIGIATILVGALGTQIAAIPGLLVWIFAGWLLASAQFWASLPFATIDTNDASVFQALAYYAVLFTIVMLIGKPQARARLVQLRAATGTAFLAIVAVVVWAIALYLLFT